jgi:hypothetical protein
VVGDIKSLIVNRTLAPIHLFDPIAVTATDIGDGMDVPISNYLRQPFTYDLQIVSGHPLSHLVGRVIAPPNRQRRRSEIHVW